MSQGAGPWLIKSVKKEDAGFKPPHYLQKKGFGTSSLVSIFKLCGFVNNQNLNCLISPDSNSLTTSKGIKKRIHDRNQKDPNLFRKMYLYSELLSLDNQSTKEQKKLIKK